MKKFNVLCWDFNTDKLTYYDVLPYLREEITERWESNKNDQLTREILKELIEASSRYQYCSRCEYEMIIHGWPVRKNNYKIDIHEQIMMNIDIITDILWNEFNCGDFIGDDDSNDVIFTPQNEWQLNIVDQMEHIKDVGELSDGYHTFNSLYEQRMYLWAAITKHNNKAWKSWKHSDGELCFGGGWFIVGINTPKGQYTYHYEAKYWDLFKCVILPTAPEWDGHTDKDVERVLSI